MLSQIGKILNFVTLGSSLAGALGTTVVEAVVLQRMLRNCAIVLAAVIVASTLVGAFLVACLYMGYLALLDHGMAQDMALLATFGASALLTLAAVTFCVLRLRRALPFTLTLGSKRLAAPQKLQQKLQEKIEGSLSRASGALNPISSPVSSLGREIGSLAEAFVDGFRHPRTPRQF